MVTNTEVVLWVKIKLYTMGIEHHDLGLVKVDTKVDVEEFCCNSYSSFEP